MTVTPHKDIAFRISHGRNYYMVRSQYFTLRREVLKLSKTAIKGNFRKFCHITLTFSTDTTPCI